MKIRKRSFWPLAILGALLTVFSFSGFGDGVASARGGRGGGGRGGRGGGGGGRGGPGGGMGGGNRNTSGTAKGDEERKRRDERLARVALAREVYAKKERRDLWDAEASQREEEILKRIIRSVTE